MSKRILRALFAAVAISAASMGTVGTAQAQVALPPEIVAACASVEADAALCQTLISEYVAALGLTGAELEVALVELATALAELPQVSKAVDAIVAAAIETIADAAPEGSTIVATLEDLAEAVVARDDTGAISPTDV